VNVALANSSPGIFFNRGYNAIISTKNMNKHWQHSRVMFANPVATAAECLVELPLIWPSEFKSLKQTARVSDYFH
jgi:hypothetical protein